MGSTKINNTKRAKLHLKDKKGQFINCNPKVSIVLVSIALNKFVLTKWDSKDIN